VDSEWLRTTLKVPNISISNFGGDSGIRIDKIGKEVTKKIMNNLIRIVLLQGECQPIKKYLIKNNQIVIAIASNPRKR
jgi:hypothetical protein